MVYTCYKNVKRLFRKLPKSCAQSSQNELYHSLGNLLHRVMKSFWKRIKRRRKSHIHSSMYCSKLADYYASIMHDNSSLTYQQQHISDQVKTQYTAMKNDITLPRDVDACIQKLKRNCSPGIGGITTEYLIHGRLTILCEHLSVLYSVMLTHNNVPSIFATGLMVPVLKKPTLDSDNPLNYRPITLAKLFELLILPTDVLLCFNQFGFHNF